MQSFLDVGLISVISGAVALLFIILISFILTSRRCSSLEKENEKLRHSLDEAIAKFSETTQKSDTAIEALERKVKVSENTLKYLTDAQQNIVDKQKVIDHSFDNLTVKVEQQKKEIQNNSVENQPIILAKNLLAQGMSVNEVIMKTNLPSYEVEMLAKVHNLAKVETPPQAPTRSVEDVVREKIEEFEKAPQSSISQMVASSNAQAMDRMSTAQEPHHVANIKARDAYGISSRSSLRRTR